LNTTNKIFRTDLPKIDFENKVFVLTGDFIHIKRNEAKDIILQKLGEIKSDVSSKVDFLIVGEKASKDWIGGNYGTKIQKAIDKKIDIIPESYFIKFINNKSDNNSFDLNELNCFWSDISKIDFTYETYYDVELEGKRVIDDIPIKNYIIKGFEKLEHIVSSYDSMIESLFMIYNGTKSNQEINKNKILFSGMTEAKKKAKMILLKEANTCLDDAMLLKTNKGQIKRLNNDLLYLKTKYKPFMSERDFLIMIENITNQIKYLTS